MAAPKCPHCGYEFDAEDIYHTGSTIFPTENDGDESDTTCSNCESPLKLVLDLTPSWRFVDDDYEDIHK